MPTSETIDMKKVLEDLFLVLTEKEKWVVTKRFSLDDEARWTLEKIGQKFSVTRERIRQIEKIALAKLKRTAPTTKLKKVGEVAFEMLSEQGGVSNEKEIVTKLLEIFKSSNKEDASIVKLALAIHPEIIRMNKSDLNHAYYHFNSISIKDIQAVTKKGIQVLEKKGDVMNEARLISELASLFAAEEKQYSVEFIRSVISTDRRIKKTENGIGLMTWRHVNPKSIRDKAYLILKKIQHPLHFQEIATKITQAGFDKKRVTVQAVHNELIRYEQFVLVGRGLYALKEWGYKEGTVSDIIRDLLKKKSPLTKQEIITGVLKQRKVKHGTISLNLQNNPTFIRVGRALYALEAVTK